MAFRKFKEAEADEFVLDLRYNRGGSISSSQLLATMLVPEAYMGKEFIHLKYNKLINRQYNLLFDKSVIGRGANINPQRLYIITSESTASASEAIINGLRPYMNSNLIQVGETTFGKNVGQALFTNEKWQSLEVWPTSFNLFNSEDFGDYEEAAFSMDRLLELFRNADLPQDVREDYESGETLLERQQTDDEYDQRDVSDLLIDQIEFANIIVVTIVTKKIPITIYFILSFVSLNSFVLFHVQNINTANNIFIIR